MPLDAAMLLRCCRHFIYAIDAADAAADADFTPPAAPLAPLRDTLIIQYAF